MTFELSFGDERRSADKPTITPETVAESAMPPLKVRDLSLTFAVTKQLINKRYVEPESEAPLIKRSIGRYFQLNKFTEEP
jgi:hypothetical protein